MAVENQIEMIDKSLGKAVEKVTSGYLLTVNEQSIVNLYQLIMEEIEAPLYEAVIKHCRFNQSRATIMLGVSRGTLRAKLRYYFDDKYVGTRGE